MEDTFWLNYAAIAIAALSFVSSFVFGLRNRGTAKRALAISERQEERHSPSLSLYLNDSAIWSALDSGRLLGFHVQTANSSDRASSLIGAELHITYSIGQRLVTVKVPHGRDTSGAPGGVTPISLPRPIQANSAASGWFLFHIADDLVDSRQIDRYDIVVRDIHDLAESLQVSVLREAADDEA
ncbi:MAG: hypothetical protein ACC652_06810 [Acidimicrobiales bacterium]